MTKILFVLTQDLQSPSGLGRYWPFARELSKLGFEVQIAALHSNFETLEQKHYCVDEVKIDYVAPMHVMKRGDRKLYYSQGRLIGIAIKAMVELCKTVLRSSADVVLVGKPHPMNGLAGILGKLFQRKKLFVDCDDYEANTNNFQTSWQRWVVSFFERRLPLLANLVTTNTYFTRDILINSGIPESKIVYIPNGVDPNRFKPVDPGEVDALRNILGLQGNRVVGFLGSLGQTSHPVDVLLEAFVMVKSTIPQSKLLLVGGGEDIDLLRNKANDLGIRTDVIFTGRIPPDQVAVYYKLMDVSVDPLIDDNTARARSPLKLFESWAAGTPFVSAKVGDRSRLAGDPPAAHLAESTNPNDLAKAIIEVLTNPVLADDLKREGLARVPTYYWENITRQAMFIYQ